MKIKRLQRENQKATKPNTHRRKNRKEAAGSYEARQI